MKKKIIFIMMCFCFFSMQTVNAASTSGSISVSSTNTVVGNSGTATLTISSDVPIAQIYGTFKCGTLGSKDLTYSATTNPAKSQTYTINWKASSAGTYTCEVIGLEVGILDGSSDGSWPTVNVASKSIKVVAATSGKPSSSGNSSSGSSNSSKPNSSGTVSEKKEYSSDNNLSSLEVEGHQFTPEFNKDTTEYKLAVDQSIEKIKINAKASHEKASISGIGEINLSNGENTIEIKVTAENGNEKIYKLIVTVSDQNPISVKIGDNEYTIVKKNNDLLEKLEHYEETSIKISDQDVIAYKNETTKTTLVILKDKDNKMEYYIYNELNNSYKKYNYITIQGITLQLLDTTDIPKYYKKHSLNIQDKKIDFYKIKQTHKVGLIYGTNIETGNTSYYVYDEQEETISKYFEEEIKLYQEEIKKLKNYLMIFLGSISLIVIIIIIISLKKNQKKKKKAYKF